MSRHRQKDRMVMDDLDGYYDDYDDYDDNYYDDSHHPEAAPAPSFGISLGGALDFAPQPVAPVAPPPKKKAEGGKPALGSLAELLASMPKPSAGGKTLSLGGSTSAPPKKAAADTSPAPVAAKTKEMGVPGGGRKRQDSGVCHLRLYSVSIVRFSHQPSLCSRGHSHLDLRCVVKFAAPTVFCRTFSTRTYPS